MQDNIESDEIKISVIIPVYNTGQYIREAVESIMNQTLREIEIIVINDGSTDNSLAIVEELATTDKRVQVFSQANQGQSVSRNEGIARARGQYLYFMDSDDFLEEDALEQCFNKCREEQLDFVFFDAICFAEEDVICPPSLTYQRTEKLEDRIFTGNEAFKAQLENGTFTPSPCLNVISKNFIKTFNLTFYPGIIHEDQLFAVILYLNAQRTACIRRTFFHRRLRDNSTMTSRFSEKNLKGYLAVTQAVLNLRKHISNSGVRESIDIYLSQMLNAVAWQAHTLQLKNRLRFAALCTTRYKKYVSTRNIGILLFKTIFK